MKTILKIMAGAIAIMALFFAWGYISLSFGIHPIVAGVIYVIMVLSIALGRKKKKNE